MHTTLIKARHGAGRLIRGEPQYLDLKQLADLEARFRLHSRAAIWLYRSWKKGEGDARDPVEKHYRELEGALLRRQAEDAVRLYAIIRKDLRRSFQKYKAASGNTKF